MNLKFTVCLRGVSSKSRAAIVRMIEDDIAAYPKRVKMTSATVEEIKSGKS